MARLSYSILGEGWFLSKRHWLTKQLVVLVGQRTKRDGNDSDGNSSVVFLSSRKVPATHWLFASIIRTTDSSKVERSTRYIRLRAVEGQRQDVAQQYQYLAGHEGYQASKSSGT
ncbi:uncharacterized protein LTR77_004188 [Saxophila tyrrhenica]|uniref:Uncharacterized protein n=1 Tax=Saxophila tyrrhenica TaxID=1690608 RepID=A0AAV9PC94_9PEZI|nr:hypothetical protein LTR77_004188 [Saxophila tyrrhenica]